VRIDDGKTTDWSDYHDGLTSRRTVGFVFHGMGRSTPIGIGVRWIISIGRGGSAERKEGDHTLEIRTRIGTPLSSGKGGIQSDLGERWERLHLGRNLRGNRPGACVGGGGLRSQNLPRNNARACLVLTPPRRTSSASVSLSAQASEMKAIHELQVWIAENLHNDLSVQKLADRTAMSVRNFERVFTREFGKTSSHYVLQMRAEAVRRQLERTDQGLKQIAAACGFGSTDSMRRAFLRSVGTTPNRYRRQLRGPGRCV
jgi:AraC-like DNA-binding protein